MRKFSVFLLCVLMMTACADNQSEYLCQDNNAPRKCRDGEKIMIDLVRTVIKKVKNYRLEKLGRDFAESGTAKSINEAQIVLFGELHSHTQTQLLNLAVFNTFLGPGDILLMEGADRTQSREVDCRVELILRVLVALKMGESYSAQRQSDLLHGHYGLYLTTQKSYDLKELNQHITCGYWDDEKAFGEKSSAETLIKRNKSMVAAIKDNLAKFRRVIILAGSSHLPWGDVLWTEKKLNKPNYSKASADYYQKVKEQRLLPEAQRTYKIDNLISGTTEPIYDYLSSNNHPYIEMIPRSHFSDAP